jgi:hypothetical protein
VKRYPTSLLLIAVVALCTAMASAQTFSLPGSSDSGPGAIDLSTATPSLDAPAGALAHGSGSTSALLPAIPLFTYSVIAAQDGLPYSGYIVGRSPWLRGKIPMSVNSLTISVIFQFLDANGNVVYVSDPTAPDACAGGVSDTTLVQNSPLLNNPPVPFIMNGVNVGAYQYIDAFQRAEFWSLINGANYHTSLNKALGPTVVINVPSSLWATGMGACSRLWAIEINAWDSFVQSTLLPALGIPNSVFPIMATHNVVWYINTPSNCCALGYHNYDPTSGRTYTSSEFETSGAFPASFHDTVVLSHEVGEWANDPLTNNPTPPWGNIGQVSGCQNNLETGDPLTPTNVAPVLMAGYTYHLQEQAYFSWFYGGASLGTGGKYSNNGTFGGDAIICPPGGTN